jgi:hypothetical protein
MTVGGGHERTMTVKSSLARRSRPATAVPADAAGRRLNPAVPSTPQAWALAKDGPAQTRQRACRGLGINGASGATRMQRQGIGALMKRP